MVRTNGADDLDSVPFNNDPPNITPVMVGTAFCTANFDVVVTVTPPSFVPVAVSVVPPFAVLQVTKNPVVVFVDAMLMVDTEVPPEEAANVHDAPVEDKEKSIPNPDGA